RSIDEEAGLFEVQLGAAEAHRRHAAEHGVAAALAAEQAGLEIPENEPRLTEQRALVQAGARGPRGVDGQLRDRGPLGTDGVDAAAPLTIDLGRLKGREHVERPEYLAPAEADRLAAERQLPVADVRRDERAIDL